MSVLTQKRIESLISSVFDPFDFADNVGVLLQGVESVSTVRYKPRSMQESDLSLDLEGRFLAGTSLVASGVNSDIGRVGVYASEFTYDDLLEFSSEKLVTPSTFSLVFRSAVANMSTSLVKNLKLVHNHDAVIFALHPSPDFNFNFWTLGFSMISRLQVEGHDVIEPIRCIVCGEGSKLTLNHGGVICDKFFPTMRSVFTSRGNSLSF